MITDQTGLHPVFKYHYQYLSFTLPINRNYGPTILAQRHAEMQGLQQVLWLFGEERQVRSRSLALNNTYGEKKLDSFFL